jgi:hypothetical protein
VNSASIEDIVLTERAFEKVLFPMAVVLVIGPVSAAVGMAVLVLVEALVALEMV